MRSPMQVRKAFKYKLMPTPAQATACDEVLWRCRERYNAALQERRDAWQKCRVSVTFAMQSAQLPGVSQLALLIHHMHGFWPPALAGGADARVLCG